MPDIELGFYTVRQVGKMLRMTRHAVYDLVKSGALKHHRFTERRIRISEKDLNDFIRKSRVGQQENKPELVIPQ